MMIRLLRRHLLLLSTESRQSFRRPRALCLIHDDFPKTPKPSVSDPAFSLLVESCGLSPEAALSASKKFTDRTLTAATENADSMISLFRAHGFTQDQIANIIIRNPLVLRINAEKNAKPMIDFFLEIGFSNSDIARLISSNTYILKSNLEKRIKPNYGALKVILGSHTDAITAIGHSSKVLQLNLDRYMLPNIKTLQDLGVPGHKILRFVTVYPNSFLIDSSKFKNVVGFVKKMSLNVSDPLFLYGLRVRSVMSQATWNRKLELYKSLGWSDEVIFTAFKKQPSIMSLSEKKIKQNCCFYAEKLKWSSSYVASWPVILSFSFEKTILARYNIFLLLQSKGLIKCSFSTIIQLPEKKFLIRYVNKFAEQVPELLQLYKDKLRLPARIHCSNQSC